MICPPKVLTWWLAWGGSTSSTLSTLVRSAGTASWYSWHSPGESAKTKSFNPSHFQWCRRLAKYYDAFYVPSWAVLQLSRSVMISACMSLILLRSAARLYSICSICVWGITCFSCTCVHIHKSWRCGTSFRKMSLCAYLQLHKSYLPSFSASGNKSGKGIANFPLPGGVEIFTSHQYAYLKCKHSPQQFHFFKNIMNVHML